MELTDAPDEFRIFREGINATSKGNLLFDEIAARKVMFEFIRHGTELFIDADHSVLEPSGPPTKGKAFGWFTPEVRHGELWATNVAWTDEGRTLLENREYRYFSPVVGTEPDPRTGALRVTDLFNVALTNIPAMRRLDPLVASRLFAANKLTEQGDSNEMIVKLAEISDDTLESMQSTLDGLMGLLESEDATAEDKVQAATEGVAALKAMLESELEEPDEAAEDDEELESDDDSNSQAATEDVAELLSKITETASNLKVLEEDRESSQELANDIAELFQETVRSRSRVEELSKQLAQRELEDEITSLTEQGKLVPSQHAWARSLNIDSLRSFGQSAPVVLPTDEIEQPPKATSQGPDLSQMTESDEQLCRKLGLTSDEQKLSYMRNKRAQMPTGVSQL